MRIVTIARKPFAGSTTVNVVEHQAGALNIEATRVGVSDIPGRWPANVILMHTPKCKIVGERKVPSGTAVRHRSGGKTVFSETDKPLMEDMSYADADGKETVPQWACEEGCPVAELDGQVGLLKSGVGSVKRSSASDTQGNQGAAYGSESRAEGTPVIFYGDQGGASRFFKQFKSEGSTDDGAF